MASSAPIPAVDQKGSNPPHAITAARYRELVDDGHFLCTGEHPSEKAPEPIVFELDSAGMVLRDASDAATQAAARG